MIKFSGSVCSHLVCDAAVKFTKYCILETKDGKARKIWRGDKAYTIYG